MKISGSDIAEAAQSAGAAEEVAAEAVEGGAEAAGENSPVPAQTAMEEITHNIRAMRELEDTIMAEKGPSTGEQIGEALKEGIKLFNNNPKMAKALEAYLWGPDMAKEVIDVNEVKEIQDTPATQTENMDVKNIEELDGESGTEIAKTIVGTLAEHKPNMTLRELVDRLDNDISGEHEDMTMAEVNESLNAYEPIVQQQLQQVLNGLKEGEI